MDAAADIKRATNELKSNWQMVEREVRKTDRTGTSRAKAVGKKALVRGTKTVKKIAKKVAKKRASR